MTSFKDWCNVKYGIVGITEGKIIKQYYTHFQANWMFIEPYFSRLYPILTKYFTFPCQGAGYSLSSEAYRNLKKDLAPYAIYGLELQATVRNQPAPINLQIIDPDKRNVVMAAFSAYSPVYREDILTGRAGIEVSSEMLERLYQQYHVENQPNESDRELEARLENLETIQNNARKHSLYTYLEKAHTLSRDYDNTIGFWEYQASGSYALSLQIFAEAYKNRLTTAQYAQFMHAISSLALYNKNGILQQGLKSDSNFTNYLRNGLGAQRFNELMPDNSYSLLAQYREGPTIRRKIHDNALLLLYGQRGAALGGGNQFDALKFLPDQQMNSETNEIILQTGGMLGHSAMARIIKVGMLNNGAKAAPGMKPDYFDYFKVEANLGAGCKHINWNNKTCTGSYVTKLLPTTLINGQLTSLNTNPRRNPDIYQKQMEHTLYELIRTEREILFYRQPQQGPNGEGASPPNSSEAYEWRRLRACLDILNGVPYASKVFFDDHTLNGQTIECVVENQKGYIQEEGSCSIFSIKQLVTSILGHELTALHSHFLQTTNAQQHGKLVNDEITWIKQEQLRRRNSIDKIIGASPEFDFERLVLTSKLGIGSIISDKLANDLKVLSAFYNEKQKFKTNDSAYLSSLKAFYKQSVDVLLSEQSAQHKAEKIQSIAQHEFKHRHFTRRLIADVAMVVSMLFGVGLVVAVARACTNRTVFFSAAPTQRESDLNTFVNKDKSEDQVFIPSVRPPN